MKSERLSQYFLQIEKSQNKMLVHVSYPYHAYLQPNLYKTTSLETTQKWLSWKGGHLIKVLYQATISQIWLFMAVFFHW